MILVTGATGFLGHHLIPQLIKTGYRVRALVRPTSDSSFLQKMGAELVYAHDITDEKGVAEACRGCRYVIHGAGYFRFWGEEKLFWQTNVQGTEAVVAGALAAQVERVVHISTVVVVGRESAGTPITELSPCYPQDPYQKSKLAGEDRMLAAGRDHGLPVIVLRPGAFYGPWGRYAFNRLFFEEPLRGWRIKVHGGRHITFPVYVPDVVQGIQLALTRGTVGQIYNICGESLDHNMANRIVSEIAGISPFRLPIPTFSAQLLAYSMTTLARLTRREPFYPTNIIHYIFQDWPINSAKAQTELGFQATSFVEGAKATLEWYRQTGLLKKRSP